MTGSAKTFPRPSAEASADQAGQGQGHSKSILAGSPPHPDATMDLTMFVRVLLLMAVGSLAWSQALEQAKRAFDRGDYNTAIRLFRQAHQASPSCDVLFYIGLAHYRLKQIDQALIGFRSAVQCDPKLIPAHLA